MKIRGILCLLLNSSLFFYSFYSFSQIKTTSPIKTTLEIYDSTKVCDGYILWQGGKKSALMDRKGNLLFNCPGNIVTFFNNKEEMISGLDGNLVVYNKNLDVNWKTPKYIHHELTVTPDDNVLLLSEEFHTINNISIRFDNMYCYNSAGLELFKWSTYDQRGYLMSYMMKDEKIFRYKIKGSSDPDSVLFSIAPGLVQLDGDHRRELFHMNTIQVIPENESEKRDSVFRKGNILLSFNNYNKSMRSFIAIVDPVNFKILWCYFTKYRCKMHAPAMLPNGHILVCISHMGGINVKSTVEEIDPITKKIVWSYSEKSGLLEPFRVSHCQRLPNGNTLIVAAGSTQRIFEVTPDKKIVWQFFTNNQYVLRTTFYSKERLKWLLNDE